ncbi:hypothetical protein [Stenotrophomonas maltophilia]|uniref:hypothetical protein n=1 Tax=Stenotrophomonas maltophilia TaxID=40324 RepID=UPI001E2E95FD|nr:hypothetical protein [Stenotrophomonas maltophilia]
MSIKLDMDRVRREQLRWVMLLALHNASPYGAFEEILISTAQALHPDATQLEVRRALEYLKDRCMVSLDKKPDGRWWADLTRLGTDIVEYTAQCEPGIARPEKYW